MIRRCVLLVLFALPALAQDVLVSSRFTSQVLRYDGASGAFKGVFASGSGMANPNGIAYGPDGHLYAGNGDEGVVLRYDGQTGAFIDRFIDTTAFAGARGMRFGPDGDLYVAAGSIDKILRFDGRTGALVGTAAEGNGISGPVGLDVAPDGTIAVGGALSNAVYFFRNGQFLRACSNGALSRSITGVLFAPDGTLYAATAQRNSVLRVNTETCAMTVFATPAPLNIGIYLELAPDGNVLVGSFASNSVLKLDAATGALLSTFVATGAGGLNGTHDIAVMPAAQPSFTPAAIVPGAGRVSLRLTNPTDAPIAARLGVAEVALNARASAVFEIDAPVVLETRDGAPLVATARTSRRAIDAFSLASRPAEQWLDGLASGAAVGVANIGSATVTATVSLFTEAGLKIGNDLAATLPPLATFEWPDVRELAAAGPIATFSARVTCAVCAVYASESELFIPAPPARNLQWLGGIGASAPPAPHTPSKRRAAAPATSTPIFRTSIVLANHGAAPATVPLEYTPDTGALASRRLAGRRPGALGAAARDAAEPAGETPAHQLTLPANTTRTLDFGEIFGHGVFGTVAITSDLPIAAWARIANGPIAEHIPSLGIEDAIPASGAILHGIEDSATAFTTLSILNTSDSASDATVASFNDAGAPLGQTTHHIEPGQTLIVDRVPVNGSLKITPSNAGALIAWATRIDYATTDKTFIRAAGDFDLD